MSKKNIQFFCIQNVIRSNSIKLCIPFVYLFVLLFGIRVCKTCSLNSRYDSLRSSRREKWSANRHPPKCSETWKFLYVPIILSKSNIPSFKFLLLKKNNKKTKIKKMKLIKFLVWKCIYFDFKKRFASNLGIQLVFNLKSILSDGWENSWTKKIKA